MYFIKTQWKKEPQSCSAPMIFFEENSYERTYIEVTRRVLYLGIKVWAVVISFSVPRIKTQIVSGHTTY